MFQLDFGDHRPLYEQIKDKIKTLIITGVLSEHDKVPSVRELAATLTINPNTIQKAYRDLEQEGFIYSLRAKGSFVAPQSHIAGQTDVGHLLEDLETLLEKLSFCGVSYEKIIKTVNTHYGQGKKEDNHDSGN